MKSMDLKSAVLRLRIALDRFGVVGLVAAIVLVAAVPATLWMVNRTANVGFQIKFLRGQAGQQQSVAAAPVTPNDNLEAFYKALGEKRYAEQQVRTLFGIAAKAGLVLNQGEYKTGYDQAARVATYQVVLPVRGSYQAIWQFAGMTLSAIPFASLDEINFRRETINDNVVEARLRFTMYLDGGGAR